MQAISCSHSKLAFLLPKHLEMCPVLKSVLVQFTSLQEKRSEMYFQQQEGGGELKPVVLKELDLLAMDFSCEKSPIATWQFFVVFTCLKE